MPFIHRRRIWWETVPGVAGYVVYASTDHTVYDPKNFSRESTPGITFKLVSAKNDLFIPDEWPEFPAEQGKYYIAVTSRDGAGNQSDPFVASGLFKFIAPSPPAKGGIDTC